MELLEKFVLPLIIFAGIVVVIIAVLNFLLKMKILKSQNIEEEHIKLLRNSLDQKSSNVKWALLMLFAGIGLFIIGSLHHYAATTPFAIEAICCATALGIYHLYSRRTKN